MTAATHIIQTAINDSIREDRAVTLRVRRDSQDYVDLMDGLRARCEDWTRADVSRDEDRSEFWGRDEDGDDWRVHVLASDLGPSAITEAE